MRLLRELYGPDERIVVMVHNGHAQRVPFQLLPGVTARSAGRHLAADYAVIGITALEGDTTDVRLDEHVKQGFAVMARPLGPPVEDGVERAVAKCGPLGEGVLLDLRPARGAAGPTSIRHAYLDAPVDVVTAFDTLAVLPTMCPSSFVPAEG